MADFKHAVRTIVRRPGFTLVLAGTLAVGVGANTAIFSAIEATVLRGPPFPRAAELRLIRPVLRSAAEADTLGYWSYPMFEAFRAAGPEIGAVASYTPLPGAYNLATAAEPHRVFVELASTAYLPVLGLTPALGRWFAPDEDRVPGEPAVAVLAHHAWVGLFGGDSAVVGRTIRLNATPLTVVGIAPPGFRGLSGRADAWAPMMMAPALTFPRRLEGAFSFWHAVVARVPPELTDDALNPALAARAAAVAGRIPLAQAFGDVELGFHAEPLARTRVQPGVRTALAVLMGAAAFVLLIVCVNAANLLLTQATRRRRELGIRMALGASRAGIARTLLAESLVLGALGGAGGLLVAAWLLDVVRAIAPAAPAGTTDPAYAALGPHVLLFNFGLAALAALLAGLLPAWRAARADPHAVLQTADPRTSPRSGARGALIAAEVALALVLLTGAGLMLRTLANLRATDPGFRSAGLLTATVDLPRQAYAEAELVPILDALRERAAALPGVTAASVANCLPLAGGCDNVGLRIHGRATPDDAPTPSVAINMVDAGYFRTMGIRLLDGRTFGPADRRDAPRVAILTRAAAERFWPGEDPVGARIQLTVGWEDHAEVVGVVEDVRHDGLDAPPPVMVYLPHAQWSYRSNFLVVRTAGPPMAAAPALRGAVRDVDPGLPLWDLQTMDERVGATLAATRFTTILLSLAAVLAALLTALGVFAVIAFRVATRSRELGVRMALGARGADVVSLVLRDAMRATAIGLAAGLTGAVLLTRVLESQLHDVSPTDPAAIAGAVALMTLTALGAAYVPARRAARVDPVESLRRE